MNVELHVIEGGVDRGPLPSFESVNLSPVFCDYGTISFKYPKNGKRFAALLAGKDEIEIIPYVDGVPYPRFGGLVQEIAGDDIVEAGLFEYAGIGYLALLDEARVYPFNWPSVDPQATAWKFTDATAGAIIRALVQAAQERGSLAGVTTAFSNTTDSAGVPWNKTLNVEIAPGVTITEVLKNLRDQGMCEFVMNGRELRMHIEGGLSTDRTAVTPPAKPLTFRRGRDLKDSPRKTSTRELATVMLAAGKEDTGLYHEKVDATAVANRRRIEGYVSNGSVTDPGTLNAFSEYNLSQRSQAKMEKSHGLEFVNKKSPRPIVNFDVGDWCYSDTNGTTERLRIKQWVLSVEANGNVTGSVVLNDLFAEISEKLSKRIEGIIGGTTITGESRAEDVVPDEVVDLMPPKTPTGLTLSSLAYTDERAGQTYAQMSAAWVQVTQNEDGTAIEDLAEYQLRWRYTAEAPGYKFVTVVAPQTVASWSPLTTDAEVSVEIRAVDKNGNASPWSNFELQQTGFDAVAPEVPATPAADNYLGMIRLSVSGLTASGAAWAPDFNVIEVHASTVANFTPVDSGLPNTTHIDTHSGAGRTLTRGVYGAPTYFKIRAVDHNGNKSAFTPEVSASATQVVSNDVFDGAIGSAKIADLAVTSAKINNLAVNTAQIGEIEIGKLVAGILNAQVILGNRIATAATGARTELNQIGLQAWNSANEKVIDFNGVNNLLTGTFRTATTGRRIEMASTEDTNMGKIRFFAPDGTVGEFGVFTGANINVEALRFGIDDPTVSQFWKKFQINENDSSAFATGLQQYYVGGEQLNDKGFWVYWTPTRKTPEDPFFDDDNIEVRLSIAETQNYLKHPLGGSFQIIETLTDTTQRVRLSLGATSFGYWDTDGEVRFLFDQNGMIIRGANNRDRFQISDASGTGIVMRDEAATARLWIRDNNFSVFGSDAIEDLFIGTEEFRVTPGGGDKLGSVSFISNPTYGQSARLRFRSNRISSSDGSVYENLLKTAQGKFEFRNGSDTAWANVWTGRIDVQGDVVATGGGFFNQSDAATKRSIRTLEAGALDKVVGTKVKRYKRKNRDGGREEIGILAQEAPPEIVVDQGGDEGLAVDLYGMTALAWSAIQELHAQVTAMKEKKA